MLFNEDQWPRWWKSSQTASGRPKLNPVCCVHSVDEIQPRSFAETSSSAKIHFFFLYRVDCTSFFLTKLTVCATPTLYIWYFKLMGSLMLMSTGGAYIRFSCWNLRFWKPQFLVEVQSELTRNRLADSSEAPWQWFFRRICQKVFEQNVR